MIFKNEQFRSYRKQLRWSLTDLSSACGVNISTLGRWERGTHSPSESSIRSLAEIMKLSLDKISNLPVNTGDRLASNIKSFKNVGSLSDQDLNKQEHSFIAGIKNQRKELEKANYIISSLLSSMDSAFYIKDIDNKYVLANNAFLETVGQPTSLNVEGLNDNFFMPDIEAKINSKTDNIVIREQKDYINIQQHIPGTRKKKWGLITKVPIKKNDGTLEGMLCTIKNITKEKEMEEKLKETLNYQKRILYYFQNYFPDGVIIRDWNMVTDKPFFIINQKRLDIWGVDMDICNNNWDLWRELVHKDDRERVFDMHDNQNGINGVFRIYDRINGGIKWINEVTVTKKDEFNRVFTISINRDITKEKEQELKSGTK